MLEQFCPAFCLPFWPEIPDDSLLTHVLIEIAVSASAGTTLFAAISAIRNWLMQAR
jgi:hypothetical protein